MTHLDDEPMLISEKLVAAVSIFDTAKGNPEDNSRLLWDYDYDMIRELLVTAIDEVRKLEQHPEPLSELERWIQHRDEL